jgi:FecR protein
MHEAKPLRCSLVALAAIAATLAANPVSAQQVGTAGAVNPAAQASGRVMNVGSNILFKEKISTTAAGSVQVIFVDKTTLNIGPNSDLVIDEFVYNPNTGTGKMAATLTKGVLRVVGGNVTHTEGATIKTPVASVGVRGGVATISHSPTGGTQAINHFGSLSVTSGGTTENVYRPGFGVTVEVSAGGTGQAPSAPARATATQVAAAVQTLTSKPGQSGGALTQPTDSGATAAGLGQTNAPLTPATTPSVQAQTASQGAVIIQQTTQITQPISSSPALQSTTQGVQAAQAAQTAVSQTPTPKFYALQTTGVPYIPAAFNTGAFQMSPLYGYRRGGADAATGLDRFGSSTLQAGLSINGTGTSQTSSFFVMTGGFSAVLSPTDQFHDAGFVATTRVAGAGVGMGRASGNADSFAGSELLNSDRIPIAATLTSDNRVSVTGATDPQTSFFFRGNGTPSENYVSSSAFSAVPVAADVGQSRTAVPLVGFAGGIMRTSHAADASASDTGAVGRSFAVTGGLVVQFDGDRPRMQANASLSKVTNPNGDVNEFASGNFQAGSLTAPRARGTYIDDSRFGARDAVANPSDESTNIQISTANGRTLARSRQAFASSDLFNGNAVLTTLNPAITPCLCEYTRWGAWSMDNARTNTDGSEERDRMHIGWWVAGRMSDPAQIPAVGTATYNGQMIGTIRNSAIGAEYTSAAPFQYSANFGNPNASTMNVTNLDGVNYGGTVGFNRAANTAGQSSIAGQIPRTGGTALTSATMNVNGAFFQGPTDPVRDVAGGFTVRANPVVTAAGTNHNYIASGIFAGSR